MLVQTTMQIEKHLQKLQKIEMRKKMLDTLVGKLNKMETVIMITFWDRVLSRFKATSIHLQKSDTDSATAIDLLQSLTLLCWHTLRAVC